MITSHSNTTNTLHFWNNQFQFILNYIKIYINIVSPFICVIYYTFTWARIEFKPHRQCFSRLMLNIYVKNYIKILKANVGLRIVFYESQYSKDEIISGFSFGCFRPFDFSLRICASVFTSHHTIKTFPSIIHIRTVSKIVWKMNKTDNLFASDTKLPK